MSQLVMCVELEWIHHTTPHNPTANHSTHNNTACLTSQPRLLLTTRPLPSLPTEHLTDQLINGRAASSGTLVDVETPPLPG